MAKQKKKRTKKYSGSGASVAQPTVTRVQAVSRSRVGQWWFDRKRVLKPVLIAMAVVAGLVVVVMQVVQLASGDSF